jgi:RNA polymerase sigma-70 factor (ECF subfamily)
MADAQPPPDRPQTLFPTTRWTIIRSIGGDGRVLRFHAWEEFCRSYRRPLVIWLAARTTPENAEDLAHDFLLKLDRREHLFESIVPEKGRLRSYLLAALRNHWLDHLRSGSTRRRAAGGDLPLEESDSAGKNDDEGLFDHEWAVALLTRTVAILRSEYAARGSQTTFDALLPLLENDDGDSRRQAVARSGLAENTFNVALKRLRDRLAGRIRQEVAATLIGEDDAAIDEELRHLIAVLGRAGFGEAFRVPPVP